MVMSLSEQRQGWGRGRVEGKHEQAGFSRGGRRRGRWVRGVVEGRWRHWVTTAPSFRKHSESYTVHLFLLGAQLVWVCRKTILPRTRMTLSWAPMWHILVTMCYFCIAVTNMYDRHALKKEVYCGSPSPRGSDPSWWAPRRVSGWIIR